MASPSASPPGTSQSGDTSLAQPSTDGRSNSAPSTSAADLPQFRWLPRPREVIRTAVIGSVSPWIRQVPVTELDDVDLDRFDLVSLDVFDTCIGRLVGEPSDVFRLVGQRAPVEVIETVPDWAKLLTTDEHEEPAVDRGDHWQASEWFARQRIEAERRRRPAGGEVTFEEIWDEMSSVIPDSEVREYLRNDELTVEAIVSIGRSAVRRFADRAAETKRLVYLSDMYLDALTIERLLAAANFPTATVLVSSETGATKRTGEAFRLLVKRFEAEPKRVLHIGDNFLADGWAAARVGIKPIIVPTWRTRRLTVAPLSTPVPLADGVALALASHTAQNLSSSNMHLDGQGVAGSGPADVARRCGRAALGPAQLGFATWLDETLAVDTPALFAGRDMRTTLGLFRRIRFGPDSHPAALDDRYRDTWYLHGSRRSFALAAMSDGLTSEDRDVLTAGRGMVSERELWLRMGFDQESEPVRLANIEPRPFNERDEMWESVLRFEDLVVERARRELASVAQYWDRQGLPLNGRAAYVDLGWRGSVQRLIERCATAMGGDLVLDGHYLALLEPPPQQLRSGAIGWLVSSGEPAVTRVGIEAGIPIWELGFQALEGSTIGYADGCPVLGSFPADVTVQAAFQQGGHEFNSDWLDLTDTLNVSLTPGPALAEPMLRLINTPTPQEAGALGTMTHTDQPGATDLHQLITEPGPLLTRPRHFATWIRGSEWRPGSVATLGVKTVGLRLVSGGLGGLKLIGPRVLKRSQESPSKPPTDTYTMRAMWSGGEYANRDGE